MRRFQRHHLLLVAVVVAGASLSSGCEEGPCDPGTEGCPCLSTESCRLDELICVQDRCVRPSDVCDGDQCAPSEPKCFSSCRGDVVTASGDVLRCSDDGLIEGCLGDNVCDRGACVPGRVAASVSALRPGECRDDTECAAHQACIRGRCFSNCETNDECASGRVCHRRVCRAECSDEEACEEAGYACNLDGVCLPIVPPDAPAEGRQDGTLEVDVDRLAFTGAVPQAEVVIRNRTSSVQTVSVRKVEERVLDDDGRAVVRRVDEGEAPLAWVALGTDRPLRVQEISVSVPAGGESTVIVSEARNPDLPRWTGLLTVGNEELGNTRVALSYSEGVGGRWTGKVYYFGNFEDGRQPTNPDVPLDLWRRDRSDVGVLERIPNAFIQAWGRFRNGLFSRAEMDALLQATLTESWRFDRVRELCREAGFGPSAVCAPFGGAGSESVIPYTSAANINRVPSGVVELNFVMQLGPASPSEVADTTRCGRPGLTSGTGEHCYVGRIESSQALQYPANPEIVVRFEGDPLACQSDGSAGCVTALADLYAEVLTGARYIPEPGDRGCANAPGLERVEEPWLVPGFQHRSGEEGVRAECRDRLIPFASDPAQNVSFAAANPSVDGRPRRRTVELVDGLLVDQGRMQLILRETLDGVQGVEEPLVSYAYVVLEKDDATLEPADFQGERPVDPRETFDGFLDVSCDSGLINRVTRRPGRTLETLPPIDRLSLSRAVITGATSSTAIALSDPREETIHYLCMWEEGDVVLDASGREVEVSRMRQVFNAGPEGATSCPGGSTIIYFALANDDFAESDGSPLRIDDSECNRRTDANQEEGCLETLQTWIAQNRRLRLMARDEPSFPNAPSNVTFDLAWTCVPPGFDPAVGEVAALDRAECTDNRFDLRQGKAFFSRDDDRVIFNPLETDIHQAFRYRTQFVSRTGTTLGFAPEICRPGTNLEPYCYDPDVVEAIVQRTDCAMAAYSFHRNSASFDRFDAETADLLRRYLQKSFSQLQFDNPRGDPILEQGFERLYAELLITLGDDAYTASFASRFDLAGQRELAFEGSRFEPNGVDISGPAGFELYKLYQAAQYYELVLDRFYRLVPLLFEDIEGPPSERFVTPATVTTYVDRVIRASAQLSNAWSEVARRYQLLNRSDLAQRVIERAYTRSYLESQIVSSLMELLAKNVSGAQVDQVVQEIDNAQRRFRVAMLQMQNRFDRLDDALNQFGFLPEYVPFVALDEDSVNGFEPMLERAFERLEVAAEFEARALESSKSFRVDEADFRNQLVELQNNYRAQLGEICGTFIGDDGQVYPAIRRFAHLSSETAGLDDPCGATRTGSLWVKSADIETAALDLQRVRTEISNVNERARIAEDSVAKQCELIREDVVRFLEFQGAVDGYQTTIDSLEYTVGVLDNTLAVFAADNKPARIATGAHLVVVGALEAAILAKQIQIRELERTYEARQIGRECDYLQAELAFTVREIHLELNTLELDALNALWNLQVETQLLVELDNERKRLLAEWEEAEQLAINAASAVADPNIRIYRNDAIINADRWFERAIRDAYRATKVFEYYSSQSYAAKQQLYLIRLIDAGQPNLRNYLADLDDAFFEFEEQFGNPDTRIEVISMKDDVFRVPSHSTDGQSRPLSMEDRARLFRERLQDPNLVDAQGFLAIPFSTTFDQLSPLTHNHKILFVEVEVFGDVGDEVARVYLRQKGTGVVRTAEGDRRFFTFQPRTAVINPVVNGFRDFGQDSDGAITGPTRSIFRSYRFRERPFVNTNWELVLNLRTEAVNEDLNLAGLDDIQLYVFYTDFTGL